METNLTLNHTLYVYDIQATQFGDAQTIGQANELAALIEDTQGWENDQFADVNTGNITAFIAPNDAYYIAKGGKLYGLVAQFSRHGAPDAQSWYRIASVRPGESLVDGTPDLVELTLTRIMPRESADES